MDVHHSLYRWSARPIKCRLMIAKLVSELQKLNIITVSIPIRNIFLYQKFKLRVLRRYLTVFVATEVFCMVILRTLS